MVTGHHSQSLVLVLYMWVWRVYDIRTVYSYSLSIYCTIKTKSASINSHRMNLFLNYSQLPQWKMLHPETLQKTCLSCRNPHQSDNLYLQAAQIYLNACPGFFSLILIYIQQMANVSWEWCCHVEFPHWKCPWSVSSDAAVCLCGVCGGGSHSSAKYTHQITSVLVCCTLVVLSCYISISPDKEAAWLQGRLDLWHFTW